MRSGLRPDTRRGGEARSLHQQDEQGADHVLRPKLLVLVFREDRLDGGADVVSPLPFGGEGLDPLVVVVHRNLRKQVLVLQLQNKNSELKLIV